MIYLLQCDYTLCLCYCTNFKYLHPCNDVTMLMVDYMRENGSLLTDLIVPKTSQLCYIWSINKIKVDWFSPQNVKLIWDFEPVYHSLLSELGELVWSNEVNQPILLGEPVKTHNLSFSLIETTILWSHSNEWSDYCYDLDVNSFLLCNWPFRFETV